MTHQAPSAFLRELVLNHMETFLDGGLDPTNTADALELRAIMQDCLHALNFLERTTDLQGHEWALARKLIEFHEGVHTDEEHSPYNLATFDSLLAKLRA